MLRGADPLAESPGGWGQTEGAYINASIALVVLPPVRYARAKKDGPGPAMAVALEAAAKRTTRAQNNGEKERKLAAAMGAAAAAHAASLEGMLQASPVRVLEKTAGLLGGKPVLHKHSHTPCAPTTHNRRTLHQSRRFPF